MLLLTAYLSLFLISEVKSDAISESRWSDVNMNTTIDITAFCKNKTCIIKCCPNSQLLTQISKDGNIMCATPQNKTDMNFSKINVYKLSESKPIVTKKTLQSDFIFVHNDIFWNTEYESHVSYWCNMYITEYGSLYTDECDIKHNLKYCLDFYNYDGETKLAYKIILIHYPDTKTKEYFTVAGLITSSFFMLLVLLVYGLIPKLCNVVGVVLMAYLFTLTGAFVLRSAQLLALLTPNGITTEQCQVLSPVVYYFVISSFFWLNVMSFDFWSTIRHTSTRPDVHHHTKTSKIFCYSLYGWGIPAILTIGEVIADIWQLLKGSNFEPPFRSCMANDLATQVHLHLPIGIMTAVNWILFLMTVYKVWQVKRAVNVSTESRNTKRDEHRFGIYIKISIFMGISWILEMIPKQDLVLHIIINAFNVFIGVPIFIVFVCKKSVIVLLCKRFGIKNSFVDKLQVSQSTRTTDGRASSKKKHISRRESNEATN